MKTHRGSPHRQRLEESLKLRQQRRVWVLRELLPLRFYGAACSTR